ncbi:MAG: hypothetical protein R3D33_17495 [Hyphomicrobiaceae bacterium]
MGLLDQIFRPKRRRQVRAKPKTVGETFFINLIRSFGRAMGGTIGQILAGGRRRKRRY